jgi:site-specific recombinase XerD
MTKPLPQHLHDFLDYCEVEQGLRPTTTQTYARLLRKFFRWLEKNGLQGLKPHELTAAYVGKYRMWLARQPNTVRHASSGLSPSTQSRHLIALRALLAYFHEKNITCLPTEKVKLPKERDRHVKWLDEEQVARLLASPDMRTIMGLRDRAIVETLFSTGMRVAELVALDRKQLDGATRKRDYELSILGKGGRVRTVYFSEQALLWVKRYLAARRDDEAALFIRLGGGRASAPARLTVRGIELVVQKHAKRAGLPILATPHTLRHSLGTYLLNQGIDLRSVQEFLGHRNISTTQIYTHVTNRQLRDLHRRALGLYRNPMD